MVDAELIDPSAQLEGLHTASFGWALACTGRDRDAAAEVLQEVYLKVISGRARFQGRASFKSWLFGVIRLTALEHRRFRWLRRVVPIDETVAGEPESEPRVDRHTAEHLAAALLQLSARQREVLHLTFYEELTVDEAAHIMGVSPGTARTHYERGKQALLARLAQQGVGFP